MTKKIHCPECGHTSFRVVCQMLVDVTYDKYGNHSTGNGPYGDIEFDDDSRADCYGVGCHWYGTLGDLVGPPPSDAAKAAAVLCFTLGIADAKAAVKLYNKLSECEDDEAILEVLENTECPRWGAVERLDPSDWWDNVVMLAKSIDECQEELA